MRRNASNVICFCPDFGGLSSINIAGPEYEVIQTKIQEVYSGVQKPPGYFYKDSGEEFVTTRDNYVEFQDLLAQGTIEERKEVPPGIPGEFMLNIVPKETEQQKKGKNMSIFDPNMFYELFCTESAKAFLTEHCNLAF